MKKINFFFTLLAVVLIAGCAPLQLHRLPAYDYALGMEQGVARPKLFYADTIKIDSAITPYAVLSTFEGGGSDYAVRRIWQKASEIKADLVIIKHGPTQYAGNVGTAVLLPYGGATAISAPVYQNAVYGYCFRINPSRIGFQTGPNNMITEITNDSLRNAGIMEGDNILSINNIPYPPQGPELLKINEGEDVSITVIRPGTGKIEKNIKTIKNNKTFLDYSDVIPWETPQRLEEPMQ